MPNYWSLNFLKSLSFKLSHLYRRRVLELKWFWNYWKYLWRWGGWFIPAYVLKECISQRRCCLYYSFKVQSWKCKYLLNIEKRCWKKILKILHFEVLNASFHCEICSIFRKLFKELHDPFAAVFIFHDCTINKCFL